MPAVTAELFTVPLGENEYIVYAPLRRAAFLANAAMVNFITDLQREREPQDGSDADQITAFLRSLEIVDGRPEIVPSTSYSGTPQPTSITLFLTTACNLRCTYCYACAGDTRADFMSLDVAKHGIDFVIDNAVRRAAPIVAVTFHGGGEPTVHWKVMTEALNYARERCKQHNLELKAYSATNGVLTDDHIGWIIDHLNGLSVSFDGLPEVHDANRLTVLGQGSSGRVIHVLSRLDAAAFPYGIRMTVTADHIADLPRSVEFMCSRFSPQRIMVEPAYNLGRWRESPSAESEAFITSFRAAERVARAAGRALFYSAARVGVLTSHFCGVTQDAFALSPSGNVSACYETFSEDNPLARVFFYGAPKASDGGYEFNLPVLDNLRSQAVDRCAFCEGCFAKWTCAGDCYHKALVVSSNGEFQGSDRCHITRELTKDQILAKIAESGGMVWHEGGLMPSA